MDLSGCTGLKGGGLYHLREMLGILTTLDLSRCSNLESSDGLLFQRLVHLNLEGCVHLKSLFGMASGVGSLVSLNLSGCKQFTDANLKELSGLPLTDLNLSGCEQLTGEGLFYLSSKTPLASLSLAGCYWVGDAYLESLKGFPLTNLDVEGCEDMNGSGLWYVKDAPLRKLKIRNTSIRSRYIDSSEIWRCPIEEIDASGCWKFGLRGVGKMRGITSLDWSHPGNWLSDEELVYLEGKPLTFLSLAYHTRMTDAGLECLRGLPLTQLDITRCSGLTQAALGLLNSLSDLKLLKLSREGGWLDRVPGTWVPL